jgi:uncharacterized membrane protein
VDGILLHQILQWHHMVSSTGRFPTTDLQGLKDNTLADGLFHAGTWIATALGVFLLWRASRRGAVDWDNRSLLGWTLAGWGLFNLVEGIVDHHVLQIHHVRQGVPHYEVYDAAFLLIGGALVIGGTILGRTGRRRSPVAGRSTTKESGDQRARP